MSKFDMIANICSIISIPLSLITLLISTFVATKVYKLSQSAKGRYIVQAGRDINS